MCLTIATQVSQSPKDVAILIWTKSLDSTNEKYLQLHDHAQMTGLEKS